jgi:hypothetical protein
MKCPDCENGTVIGFFARMADGTTKPVVKLPCPCCQGTCQVPDEMPERRAAGKQLHELRLSRRLGLRQAAELLGMLPSDLCNLEHGRSGAPVEPIMEKIRALDLTH